MNHCLAHLITSFAILVGSGIGCTVGHAQSEDSDPLAFRQFTDKRGQQMEARVLSFSVDLLQLTLERLDGETFELPITTLSLDDQQFLKGLLQPSTSGPSTSSGVVSIFGKLSGDKPINVDALAEIDDISSLHASKRGWVVLRKSGEIASFDDRLTDLADVRNLSVNTVWTYYTKRDGTVGSLGGNPLFPELITDAIQCVGGSGHSAALLKDGTVKVWGRDYDVSEPVEPPQALSGIIQLSTTQDSVAAVHKDGRVFSWTPGKPQMLESMPGDGAVEIQGSIFDHLVRTKSGEVFLWRQADVTSAQLVKQIADDGPFLQIRCNGATKAAQKEDRSWIAWGINRSGIVDHINALGPVSDLAFFSEPGKQEMGYVIWRE